MKKTYILITSFSASIFSIIAFLKSQDKPTAGLTMLAIVISAMSLWKSVDIAEENSKQTEKSLKLTEIERKKRDIREQLDLFYYPLNDYLVRGPTLTQCWQPDVFDKIGFHRYLATKEIIKQFEEFRKENYSHGRESCNTLTKSINKQVESLENEYKKLKYEFDSLDKQYKKLKDTK
jgi:hypothetical protein